MNIKKLLSKIWYGFLDKTWPHRIFFITVVLVLPTLYWFLGATLFYKPEVMLKRDAAAESFAEVLIRTARSEASTPRIYRLPNRMKQFFWPPYRFYRYSIGAEELESSFVWVDEDVVVLQEDAGNSVICHEVSHILAYYDNPEEYVVLDRDQQELRSMDMFDKHFFRLEECRR